MKTKSGFVATLLLVTTLVLAFAAIGVSAQITNGDEAGAILTRVDGNTGEINQEASPTDIGHIIIEPEDPSAVGPITIEPPEILDPTTPLIGAPVETNPLTPIEPIVTSCVSYLPQLQGVTLTETTTLCPGTYVLPEGITIGADNIELDCDGATLVGNGSYDEFSLLDGSGIYDSYHYNTTIKNCIIQNYTRGIYLYGNTNSTLYNNTILSFTGSGILVEGDASSNIVIDRTHITGQSIKGFIAILGGNYFTIKNNVIKNNLLDAGFEGVYAPPGMHIQSVTSSAIFNNTITGTSTAGLHLIWSDNNLIYENIFQENSSIQLGDNSNSNKIYHNNIYSTAADIGTNNVWDNGSAGNYWSDYSGEDVDCDQIGDTPHAIPASSQDNFPLMNPVTWDGMPITSSCESQPISDELQFGIHWSGVKLVPVPDQLISPIQVINRGSEPLNGVDLELIGEIPSEWYSISSSTSISAPLAPDETRTFAVTFNIPSNAEFKEYESIWKASDAEGVSYVETPFVLTVVPFTVTITNPSSSPFLSQSILATVQTSTPTSCTYRFDSCMQPPEVLPGYGYNSYACGVSGGSVLPVLGTTDGLTHTRLFSSLREQTDYTFTATCTDANGDKNYATTTFDVDLNDTTRPVIHSFTPQDNGVVFGQSNQRFTLNYTEDNVAQITLYINEQGTNSFTQHYGFLCPSGAEQVCTIPVDLSEYDRGAQLTYYFTITDINGNMATTRHALRRHIPFDGYAFSAAEFQGPYTPSTDVIAPAGYASGDGVVDYLYSWYDKGPLFEQGKEYKWHEEVRVDLNAIQVKRDNLAAAYEDRYDEVFLSMPSGTLEYRLSFDTPLNPYVLPGKTIWLLGSPWRVLDMSFGDAPFDTVNLIRLGDLSKEIHLSTSDSVIEQDGATVTFYEIAQVGQDPTPRARISVTYDEVTEYQYVAMGDKTALAGVTVYLGDLAVSTTDPTAGSVTLFLGSSILELEDGDFVKYADGTESAWLYLVDQDRLPGGPLHKITLKYVGTHTAAPVNPIIPPLVEYDRVFQPGQMLTQPYTGFKFQYTTLANRYGASVPTTPLRFTAGLTFDGEQNQPSIFVSTLEVDAIEYYDSNGVKRTENNFFIFTDDLENPYHYGASDGSYPSMLGPTPRIKLGRNNYAYLTYTDMLDREGGYITLTEPALYGSNQSNNLTVEYIPGFGSLNFRDLNGDPDAAYVYAASYGEEHASNLIASTQGTRDYLTLYGTYVSTTLQNAISLEIPNQQFFVEYQIPTRSTTPMVTVAKLDSVQDEVRIERRNNRLHFMDEKNRSRIIFPNGFSASNFGTDVLTYKFDRDADAKGFVILHGAASLSNSQTKTLILNRRSTDSNSVCIRDSDITSVSDFPAVCTDIAALNQTIVVCDGVAKSTSFGNYTCTLNNSQYFVTGLRHSGVLEYVAPASTGGGSSNSGGGGGGGSFITPKEDAPVEDLPAEVPAKQPVEPPAQRVLPVEPPSAAAPPTGFLTFGQLKPSSVAAILFGAMLFSVGIYTQRHKVSFKVPRAMKLSVRKEARAIPAPPRAIKVTPRMGSRLDVLHPREKEIVEFLVENHGESTQAKIRHATSIPNTSMGRWILSLQEKGIISTSRDRKVKDVALTEAFIKDQELTSTRVFDLEEN